YAPAGWLSTPTGSGRAAPGSLSLGVRVELGDVEAIQARGIPAGDLRLLVLRHSRQDLGQDLPGLRERGFTVRIVRAPHHVVDADRVPQPNADRILLKTQEDIAMEEVARAHAVPEPVERLLVPLAIRVVHAGEHVRSPGELELHDGHLQAGVALENPGEDHVAQ